MTLYEINTALMALIDDESGEITDYDKFSELEMTLAEKRENILLWIKNLNADAKAIKEEEKILADRRKVIENKADNLRKYIEYDLAGEKFKTARVSVSYRKSTAVNVLDLNKIPAEYLRMKEPEADKTAIKEALNNGVKIEGAELIENISMQIK